MKLKHLLLLLTLFNIYLLNGQTKQSKQTKQSDSIILNNLINYIKKSDTIVLLSNIPHSIYEYELKSILNNDKYSIYTDSNKFIFTKKEKKYLLKQVRFLKPNNYSSIDKIIVFDSLHLMLKYLKTNNKKLNFAYNIEKPIYFRNNQYCMIKYTAYCGYMCGHFEILIYKKIANKWEKYKIINKGVF